MAIMRQFSTMSEQFADIKSSIEHMSVNNSYAAVFPPLEEDGQACGRKETARQRVLHEAAAETEGASDSESNMDVVTNARNARKAAKRRRAEESPTAPSALTAPTAPRSYSSAVTTAPAVVVPKKPVFVGISSTSTLKASKHLDIRKIVYRIGNIDVSYDESDIMAYLKSIDVNCFSCFERTSDKSPLKLNKTFRVCILVEDIPKLQSREHWSEGIAISEWVFRPKKPDAEGGRGESQKGRQGPKEGARGGEAGVTRFVKAVRKEMGEGSGTQDGSS